MKELKESEFWANHLVKYWHIYASIIFGIGLLFSFGNRLGNVEAKQTYYDKQQMTQQVTLAEIQSRLASIDTSLQFLKERKQI